MSGGWRRGDEEVASCHNSSCCLIGMSVGDFVCDHSIGDVTTEISVEQPRSQDYANNLLDCSQALLRAESPESKSTQRNLPSKYR